MMSDLTREAKLNLAFVKLADTLIADFDVVDLMQTLVEECADILATEAGGILIVDPSGALQLVASTSEESALVEIMQLNAGAGPCVDCITTGRPVSVGDIAGSGSQWPAFRQEAIRQGFTSVHATPMRLRGQVIGAMNLFSTHLGELNPEDVAVAQALADVATIGLLQERSIRESGIIAGQLQNALNSRVVIEQAKGVVSENAGLSMSDAFSALRNYARNNNLTLSAVASAVVDRSLNISAVMAET
jgi:GAF domain-containing protein